MARLRVHSADTAGGRAGEGWREQRSKHTTQVENKEMDKCVNLLSRPMKIFKT